MPDARASTATPMVERSSLGNIWTLPGFDGLEVGARGDAVDVGAVARIDRRAQLLVADVARHGDGAKRIPVHAGLERIERFSAAAEEDGAGVFPLAPRVVPAQVER